MRSLSPLSDEDVLAQAIRAWVGFDLADASVVECATARAIDLYALGSSVAEACQLARNFVTSWLEFCYDDDPGIALRRH